MGAPTGSGEVRTVTFPWETTCAGASSRKPLIVTVARLATEGRLMACHIARSGVQECAAAIWSVSFGGALVSATQSGSIHPIRRRAPWELVWIAAVPSPNETSIRQRATPFAPSRHRKVGGVISGGKIDPSAG